MNSFTTCATYIIFVTWSVSCVNSYSKVESKIEWEAFKKEYGKSYNLLENDKRFPIFAENLKFITEHNKRAAYDNCTYRLGLNQYSDLSYTERLVMNGHGQLKSNQTDGVTYLTPANLAPLPDHVDWREKGYVTPVKNQGQCGSCWAFSATGTLEGQHYRATGKLVSLSEQQLIDCDLNELACLGGQEDDALMYIIKNNGIDTEKSYPYQGKIHSRCYFNPKTVGATATNVIKLPHGDESKLKEAVATVGPIAVAIDANHPSFMSYKSGVLTIEDCSKKNLDHAVLVVGYGTDGKSGLDYWLVKNSWGTSWGEQGYVRMARNYNNMCGIATDAAYPLV